MRLDSCKIKKSVEIVKRKPRETHMGPGSPLKTNRAAQSALAQLSDLPLIHIEKNQYISRFFVL